MFTRIAAFVPILLTGPALAATIIDLGTPGGAVSDGLAINNATQITGYSYPPPVQGRYAGFLWQAGTMSDIGGLGGLTTQGLAITSSAQIAGFSYFPHNPNAHAFRWTSGSI